MDADTTNAEKELWELIALIKKLRAPDGCPWDRKQTMQDLGKYLLDETYEVKDALDDNHSSHIREELGDVLFLICFASEIASESGRFSLADVIADVRRKMIRRHPHVFGDVKVDSVQDVKTNWLDIKKQERNGEPADNDPFAKIPRSLCALKRAQKITDIASRLGFDWSDTDGVIKKLHEELHELAEARQIGNADKIEEEMGDLFFTLVNLSRFLHIDAEAAASKTTNKFLRRFAYIVDGLTARGQSPEDATQADMDALWDEAKKKGI